MPDLLETLGRVVLSFQSAPQGVPGRIWDEVGPWLANLVRHAAPKWLPRLSFGFECALPRAPGQPCPRPAIAACDACGRPCCLDHARIDQWGDATCYVCCWEAKQRSQAQRGVPPGGAPPGGAAPNGAPPSPPPAVPKEQLAWARKTLGVKRSTDWTAVERTYRELLAKWHPDRHPDDRAGAEARFKEVRRAYDLLVKDREAREAA